MATGDLGYWYSIDTVDETGRISEDLRRVLAYRRKRAQYDRRKAVAASG